MAVSAFKSTTKRVCDIGVGSETESASVVPFQPSTPFNKRALARSRSFSDFSSRYPSDCALAAGDANSINLDSLFRRGKVSSRYQSDDSESDADSMYSRHTCRSRQIAEIGASRKAALQNVKTKGASRVDGTRKTSLADTNYKEITDFLSCLDAPSDTESMFTRLPFRGVRADAQSDAESVFSRLSRPRQSLGQGPPRTGALQNGKSKGTRSGPLRRCTSQIDYSCSFPSRAEQSDTESSYSRHTHRSRQSADFGSSRRSSARKKGTRQAALWRSSSQAEHSDSSVGGLWRPSLQQDDFDSTDENFIGTEVHPRPEDEDAPNEHPEEEKTIRAVHTQNKDPRAPELDAISLYDAMRVEMRKAVSDIRSEIEQKSASKDLVVTTPSLQGGNRIPVPEDNDDNDSRVAEVRREYAAKLEQSEKRAHDLWTQLAAEEQRCVDLVKVVTELMPVEPGSRAKPLAPPPRQSRQIMGPDVEQQLVSQCLDADAQRYFDECVSISGLDITSVNGASSCGVDYQESGSPAWSVKDTTLSSRTKNFGHINERKKALLEPLISFCAQIEKNGRCTGKTPRLFARAAMSDDGLVLPWLQWETDVDLFEDHLGKHRKKGGNMSISRTGSSSDEQQALTRSKSFQESTHSSGPEKEPQLLDILSGVSGLGCMTNGDLSSWKTMDFGHMRSDGSSKYDRGRYDGHCDTEMFVLQRMRLRHRIKEGRILICGGIRF